MSIKLNFKSGQIMLTSFYWLSVLAIPYGTFFLRMLILCLTIFAVTFINWLSVLVKTSVCLESLSFVLPYLLCLHLFYVSLSSKIRAT